MSAFHIFDFIQCFSSALDLVVPDLSGHHKRVAYIARAIAAAMGLSEDRQYDIMTAGMLHDAGALTLKSRMDALEFESRETSHAETGYLLMRKWPSLRSVADIIRRHHVRYDQPGPSGQTGILCEDSETHEVCEAAHILHLADRVDALLRRKEFVLNQVPRVCREIKRRKGTMFDPAQVEAFLSLAGKEYFWLDIVSNGLPEILGRLGGQLATDMFAPDMQAVEDFTRLFVHVIDFRSRFTATHSAGVAMTARTLGEMAGFDPQASRRLLIAGHLHDLGKLAAPTELLEKKGPLTLEEYNLIKSHAYHTHRLLLELPDFDDIRIWAAAHHESPDGAGYPFHLKGEQLSLGSRIMAVADVFTAISEDRPYRRGMLPDEAAGTLRSMAAEGRLDPRVCDMLFEGFEDVDRIRQEAQKAALSDYAAFRGEAF